MRFLKDLREMLNHQGNRTPKIVVIGDSTHDSLWYGTPKRVLRDSSAPEIELTNTLEQPGAAAFVAWQADKFGVDVDLVTVIGSDDIGDRIHSELKAKVCDPSGIIRDPKIRTRSRIRIAASDKSFPFHKICRIVQGSDLQVSELEPTIVEKFRTAVEGSHLVIITDHGIGLLTKSLLSSIRSICNRSEVRILFDPSPVSNTSHGPYFVIKPNLRELQIACRKPDTWLATNQLLHQEIDAAVDDVFSAYNAEYVVATLGDLGVIIFSRASHSFKHLKPSRPINGNPTNAGDYFLAAFAVELCNQDSISVAASSAHSRVESYISRKNY